MAGAPTYFTGDIEPVFFRQLTGRQLTGRQLAGRQFADALSGPPTSAFLADGSPVTVMRGRRI